MTTLLDAHGPAIAILVLACALVAILLAVEERR
jgi:hypothetical protein